MKFNIKASVTAVLVTAISSTSVGVVGSTIFADPAFAKSDKAGGKSSEARGNSQKERSNRGKGKERSSNRSKPGGLETLFGKLIGTEKRKVKSSSPTSAKVVSQKPSKNSDFHPSELGNMNGALNANVNAVLAHIRNGNQNGPVGHVAALMAATANAEGDAETVALEDAYRALDVAIDRFGSVDGYFASLDAAADAQRVPSLEDYLSAYGSDATGTDAEDALAVALSGTDYEGRSDPLGDYQTAIDDAREAARDDSIEDAIVVTGYQISDGSFSTERPSESDPDALADAEIDLQAEKDAEAAILSYWNKNPGGEANEESGYTPEEEQLLNDLRDRFTEEELHSIRELSVPESEDPDDAACDSVDIDCEEDDLASL